LFQILIWTGLYGTTSSQESLPSKSQ